MTVAELLSDLESRGIQIRAEGANLRFRAPEGSLTPDLREQLKLRKSEILAALEQRDDEARPDGDLVPRPHERHAEFPLTDMQQAYLVGRTSAFELGNVACHGYREVDARDLDLDRLQTAWRRLIEYHDMLRAVITDDARQKVLESVPPYEIRVVDARGGDEKTVQTAVEQVRSEMAQHVMSANEWPLFEIRAVRVAESDYRIHLSVDLLIMDIWSYYRLIEQWAVLYADPDAALQPLDLSFRDCVLAERAQKQAPAYREARDYWLNRLPTLAPAAQLPVVAPPAELACPDFVAWRKHFDAAQWAALEQGARSVGVTPTIVLATVFCEVLRTLTGQDDHTITLTLFNRSLSHPQIDDIVGDFTSLLLLEATKQESPTFADAAHALRDQLVDDLDHTAFSGVELIREIGLRQFGAPGAVMPIVFTSALHDGGRNDREPLLSWMGDVAYAVMQTPQVWLDVQAVADKNGLTLNWSTIESLFPPGLMRDAFEAFHTLVTRLTTEPDCWNGSWNELLSSTPQLEQVRRWQSAESAIPVLERGFAGETVLSASTQAPTEEADLDAQLVRRLTDMAREVLELDTIGPDTHLLNAGATSLHMIRIATRMDVEMGYRPEIADFYQAPTVTHLATLYTRHGPEQAPASDAQTVSDAPTGEALITHDEEHRYDPFPLTEIQEAYWIGRSGAFDLGHVACCGYREFEALDLDPERLMLAWQKVVDRHDMLRAIVQSDGRQKILDSVPAYRFETDDLRGQAPEAIDARIAQTRARMSSQVMQADQWPLFEVHLTRTGETDYRVHLCFDLLILDLWSIRILQQEWGILYADPDTQLLPVEITFRDCVLAQREQRKSATYAAAKDYWWDRIPSLPPAPGLPVIAPEKAQDNPEFVAWRSDIRPATWSTLKSRAKDIGVSPTALLVGALCEVLRLASSNPDFTMSLTVFNRPPLHPQVNDVIGDFTSVLLLEPGNATEPTFQNKLEALQERLWQDMNHLSISGVEVIQELIRRRRDTPGAVMPVVMTAMLPGVCAPQQPSFTWLGKGVHSTLQTPQVWLDVQTIEEAGGVFINWISIESLFPAGLMQAMFEGYTRLLELLAAPDVQWSTPWTQTVEALALPSVVAESVAQGALPQTPATAPASRGPGTMGTTDDSALLESELVEPISRIVSDVLELDRVDPQSDLITLGASSVDIIRIANRLDTELGFRPQIDDFYRNPTILALIRAQDTGSGVKAVANAFREERARIDATIDSFPLELDPDERAAFKVGQPGYRRDLDDRPFVQLSFAESEDERLARYSTRRSQRTYKQDPIPLDDFSGLVGVLAELRIDRKPKYLYASSGGLYPVQVYIHVKPGRITGLDGGLYYHHPVKHGLARLCDDELPPDTFDAIVNAPMFAEAAFAIFFVADMAAVAPMYSERSLDFVLIEAGLMAQLLETEAPSYGIGLCQIGGMNFSHAEHMFELSHSHVPVYAILGGMMPDHDDDEGSALPEGYFGGDPADEERDEGEL